MHELLYRVAALKFHYGGDKPGACKDYKAAIDAGLDPEEEWNFHDLDHDVNRYCVKGETCLPVKSPGPMQLNLQNQLTLPTARS